MKSMERQQRILVLGYFGYETNQLDGQTVKTRDIYRLLCEQRGKSNVDWFDTQSFRKSVFKVFSMFWKVCRCDVLAYLPAHNNLKYIFPIIFVFSKIFSFKIHYFVVGGWLSGFIENLPLHRWMLKRIKGIHVETQRLLLDLKERYGFRNVDIFPNFRFFDFTPEKRIEDQALRLVFMARIMKKKGIDWIFNLADYILKQGLEEKISITFYGPVAEEDSEYFASKVNRYKFINYNGLLQPADIHRALSQYDVMLLPTHFYTEGLPGSIVDAYISGVPVIVTRWIHAEEFVDDGRSGFIIPFENGQDILIEKVLQLFNDRERLRQMQDFALRKREEFIPPMSVFD